MNGPRAAPMSGAAVASSSALSLGLIPIPIPIDGTCTAEPLARVRLSDIAPYDGAPCGAYIRAVEALSSSLMRRNAAVIELAGEDASVLRCALESVRVFFRTRAHTGLGKTSKGVYIYRAGRPLEDGDMSPACMGDAFKCLGKVARVALSAIAKHLRLRSDVFNHLLDDNPLPSNEISSSVLVAACSHPSLQNGRVPVGGSKYSSSEVEKGLLSLVACDSPGIQVCDPNGRWYLADVGMAPAEVLLLTGRTLNHTTAGLRPAASFRTASDCFSGINAGARAQLLFRLMPHSSAILDCSPIAAAGHVIPHNFQPISVSQFMDDLSAEENVMCNDPENNYDTQDTLVREPSLRSVLSDPISGAFLEDAVAVSCGHSFGGHMLKKVLEVGRCSLCNAEINTASLIPNLALRAVATAIKKEDGRRLFHNSTLRKRRKEIGEHLDVQKENGEISAGGDGLRLRSCQEKGVQYPFAVSEKVLIKGNKRTPEKFVGREAVITSQCLNGWYLLQILDSGENVRLQYRSLQKLSGSQAVSRIQPQLSLQK